MISWSLTGLSPVTVVSDGRVMEDNLALRGLGRDWLDREVRARGAASVKEVFLMTVDEVKDKFLTLSYIRDELAKE